MAKPLGLASEAELSTSPCERHRNVNCGFSVQIALARAKVFQKLVGRLVQCASRGDHDGHDGVVKGQLLVVSIGLVHRVLQHFGDGVRLGLGFYRIKYFTIAIVSSKLYTWPSP